jgi:hypothetical protein
MSDIPLSSKQKSLDAAIGDRFAELADGSNFGTLAELQEELLAWSMDLRSGAQSILDYASPDETTTEHPPQLMAVVDKWQGYANALRDGKLPCSYSTPYRTIDAILSEVRQAAVTTEPRAIRSTEGTCTCPPHLDPLGCLAETCPRVIAARRAVKTGAEYGPHCSKHPGAMFKPSDGCPTCEVGGAPYVLDKDGNAIDPFSDLPREDA